MASASRSQLSETAGRPEDEACGCGTSGCTPARDLNRRTFIEIVGAGAGVAAWNSGAMAIAGPFDNRDAADHFVPADKKLSPEWVRALFARGAQTWYSGNDLETIGMPVGGICAGQIYLTGDGRLVYWDIFNSNHDTGYGQINYREGRKPTDIVGGGKFTPSQDVPHGVAIRVKTGDAVVVKKLDATGFPAVRFCGEYPLGQVEFSAPQLPVEIRLEAFSPFIPLNAVDSALPVTILNYTVKNTGTSEAEVTFASWLQNAALFYSETEFIGEAVRRNQATRDPAFTAVVSSATIVPQSQPPARPPIVFADFEAAGYGEWKIEGESFGTGPAKGTFLGQQKVDGFRGERLVNSFVGNDKAHGKITSPLFKIERPWIGFLIGGGEHAERTCINLLIAGKVVRTATGHNREQLEPHSWNVKDLLGKSAQLEIVDAESGGWGHINVDQIEFRDEPMGDSVPLRRRTDFGSFAIAVLGSDRTAPKVSVAADQDLSKLFASLPLKNDDVVEQPLDKPLRGAVAKTLALKPGEQGTVTFLVAWHMPNNYRENRWVGNYYTKRFQNAGDVVQYVANNFDRLANDTRRWHATYYDSTLPHWLLDRIGATVCNLATGTCQWWRNGRFWAWEGVGCCHGTCGHVWNYAHVLARLFPQLERSVREMQDFVPGIGFNAETGSIGFRGEGWTLWAGDGQGGYILKAYREHLCSPNDEFLNTNWPNIRKAIEFLLAQDANDDGLIEGRQHQTYDQEYYGANTFVGSLYLGALRAAEVMAREVGDFSFADRCRKVFKAGRDNSVKRLFNGEYYIQTVDLKQNPEWQYADGCLADHLFGQGWAHQIGLGYLYPQETVLKALQSLWKYNWAPDIAPQNKHHDPERWFAMPGEAGLFTCTWPKSKHLGAKSTRYRDEVWTGTEYQVANHMAWEGMVTECLAMCRAIHERYHPAKRNPFNEIECGDHYARSMASWGVLIGLAGFEYDGPRGRIHFAPRITPDDFKTVFTAAESWGTYWQKLESGKLTARLEPKWGTLRLREFACNLPPHVELTSSTFKCGGTAVDLAVKQDGLTVTLRFENEIQADRGHPIVCEFPFKT